MKGLYLRKLVLSVRIKVLTPIKSANLKKVLTFLHKTTNTDNIVRIALQNGQKNI